MTRSFFNNSFLKFHGKMFLSHNMAMLNPNLCVRCVIKGLLCRRQKLLGSTLRPRDKWPLREKTNLVACKQQICRPAFASAVCVVRSGPLIIFYRMCIIAKFTILLPKKRSDKGLPFLLFRQAFWEFQP